MATKGFTKPLLAAGAQQRVCSCTFTVNGSAAPVLTEANGVATVSRSGLGDYLVTLDEGGKAFVVAVSQSLSLAQVVKVGTKTPASKTIQINTVTAGSNTNADPAAGSIDLVIVVRENS